LHAPKPVGAKGIAHHLVHHLIHVSDELIVILKTFQDLLAQATVQFTVILLRLVVSRHQIQGQ
jgi:hypothetical protein